MGIRTDLPRIQGDRPTLFNYDAAKGYSFGWLAGVGIAMGGVFLAATLGVTTPLAVGTLLVTGLTATASPFIGLALGAVHGEKRMTREATHGKAVSEPTLLNNGTIAGFAAVNLTISALTLIAAPVAAIVAPFAYPILAVAMVGGSLWRYNDMKQDVAAAQHLRNGPLPAPTFARGPAQYHDSVSPSEAQQLDARMNHGASHGGHADRVDQSRVNPHQQQLS